MIPHTHDHDGPPTWTAGGIVPVEHAAPPQGSPGWADEALHGRRTTPHAVLVCICGAVRLVLLNRTLTWDPAADDVPAAR